MIRQARTGDTVLVKNRETTGRYSVSEEYIGRRLVGTVLVKIRETTGRYSVSEE